MRSSAPSDFPKSSQVRGSRLFPNHGKWAKSRHWLWLTAFVGANLFQSAFTRWCLAEKLFIALGAKPTCTVPK